MKYFRKLIIFSLVLGLFLCISLPAMANAIFVTKTSLNLRSSDSTSSSILFTMPEYTVMFYLGTNSNGFYKVQVWDPQNSKWVQGWASTAYSEGSIEAENVSGSDKYIYVYNSGWKDSGYRISDGAVILNGWSQLNSYSLSYADYVNFRQYIGPNGIVDSPVGNSGYIYGRYRVSSPSNYHLWHTHS